MPRCLVTGATGFIGPRLIRTLQAAGGDVRCLVRPTSDVQELERLGVRLVRGDVTDASSLGTAVADVDFVFHLAGRVFAGNYEQFAAVNEAGSANIAAACAAAAAPRLDRRAAAASGGSRRGSCCACRASRCFPCPRTPGAPSSGSPPPGRTSCALRRGGSFAHRRSAACSKASPRDSAPRSEGWTTPR